MAKKSNKRDILTGIEIGTDSIKVIMGEVQPDDVVAVVGIGVAPSRGVMKGEIVDAVMVQDQLDSALRQAEDSAGGQPITDIFLAVSGAHLGSVNSTGNTIVTGPDRIITAEDRIATIRNAENYPLQPDKQAIHHFPRGFVVDDHRQVDNPVGQVGGKLEADVHIIFGQHSRFDTSCRAINATFGYEPFGICASIIADAMAILSDEHRRQGVLLINLGAGVTTFGVFRESGCCHSGQITVGMDHVFNDLSLGLHLPLPTCRILPDKLTDIGTPWSVIVTPDGRSRLAHIELPAAGGVRDIPVSSIEQIIEQRLTELFEIILSNLQHHHFMDHIGNGLILCGGGALLPRVNDLARNIFDMPVTIGQAWRVTGPKDVTASPRFTTPIGLLRFGRKNLEGTEPRILPLSEQLKRDWNRFRDVIRQAFKF